MSDWTDDEKDRLQGVNVTNLPNIVYMLINIIDGWDMIEAQNL